MRKTGEEKVVEEGVCAAQGEFVVDPTSLGRVGARDWRISQFLHRRLVTRDPGCHVTGDESRPVSWTTCNSVLFQSVD